MNFNIHQSVDKTVYFLDSSITHKSLKVIDNISSQFIHQYYLVFLLIMSEM